MKLHSKLSLSKLFSDRKQGFLLMIKLNNLDKLVIVHHLLRQDIFTLFFQAISNICVSMKLEYITYDIILSEVYVFIPSASNRDIVVKILEDINDFLCKQYIDGDHDYYFHSSGSFVELDNSDENVYNQDIMLSILRYNIISNDYHGYSTYPDKTTCFYRVKKSYANIELMKQALLLNKVYFMYQPIINCKTEKIMYYECLMRVYDNNNLQSIGQIIKDMEVNGLVSAVDEMAFFMVVSELHEDQNIVLSVNISNHGVLSNKFLTYINDLLDQYKVADRLIVEITETAINKNFAITKKFIDVLHKNGCRVALDDFGSGFTSFKQILDLPIDIIKIDGSYIKDILSNENSKYFVGALVKLAEELKIKTVAEFVENANIAEYLTSVEVDSMQGDFFSPALSKRIE